MQPLERPTQISGRIDRVGLRALIFALCFAWFYLLWGKAIQAACAGAALAILWYQAIRYGEQRTLAARETSLRRKIGGQLAVDSLIFQTASNAASNAANWIAHSLPLTDFKQSGDGVIARLGERRVYIECVRKHPSSRVGRDDVLGAVREARALSVDTCVICATCAFAAEAVSLAEDLQPRTRLLGKDALIVLAGAAAPATNEQLQELGRRERGRRFNASAWKARLLQPGKARRYGAYGLGMLVMLVVTRQWVYSIPSVVCLLLFYISRRHKVGSLEL
ncbi:MAG: restriction endonuclease [Oscillospiraceae bacterium]|jgi:hypothetical protein|nr:restriction endonuclease [Oscillospiraceae bacterium]